MAATLSRRTRRAAAGAACGLAWLGLLAGCVPPGGGPLEVWAVEEQVALDYHTEPVLENDVFSASRAEIRLEAARNEVVAFQLALRTTANRTRPLQVELSECRAPASGALLRAHVRRYRVRPVRVERFEAWYPEHAGRSAVPLDVPDVLVPWEVPDLGGPVTLASGRNELVWMELAIPPDAEPGEYVGRLRVRPDRRETVLWSATVRVRVLPVVLPVTPSLPVVCRVDPGDLLKEELGWPPEPPERIRIIPDDPGHAAAVSLLRATMALFHRHRTTPVLWGCFPKYFPEGPRSVRLEWEPYDRLVGGWIDGTAYEDGVPAACWPVPVSLDYPDARREGGPGRPEYARLLSAYLSECRRHFEQRGWVDRAVVRLVPPAGLDEAAVALVRRAGDMLRQSETGFPLVAHLPARSLRGLGWLEAPRVELPALALWLIPPAGWYEPEAMEVARRAGRRTWFMPDHPPFSGVLAAEGLATDALSLPWQAARYGAGGVWIEHAADCGTLLGREPVRTTAHAECLIYPGRPFGLPGHPLPSLRLKRLCRGIQDHALLSLLAQRGQAALAEEVSRQLVRWAFTDACRDHWLNWEDTGWPRAGRPFALGRRLVLHELAATGGLAAEPADKAEWGLFMNQAERVRVAVEGVRLLARDTSLEAHIVGSVLNAAARELHGRWLLDALPAGWQTPEEVPVVVPPEARRRVALQAAIIPEAYNTEGVYPFELRLDTEELGALAATGRLALATCPRVLDPPVVDGNLADWPLASNNAAGDFLLVRGRRADVGGGRPTLSTRAFFCRDDAHLYVALRCDLPPGERPLWRADNNVPMQGAVPWGQDVVELVLDPRPVLPGTGSDLFILQVKPNGVVLARRGCPTNPPVNTSEPWNSGVNAAVAMAAGAWTVELALPLEALGPRALENRVWGLNVTRLDARRGEYSSWSGAHGDTYRPHTLGNLLVMP